LFGASAFMFIFDTYHYVPSCALCAPARNLCGRNLNKCPKIRMKKVSATSDFCLIDVAQRRAKRATPDL